MAGSKTKAAPRAPGIGDLLAWGRELVTNYLHAPPKPLSTIAALRERYADDFIGFCALLKVQHAKTGLPVPLELTEVQRWLNNARTGRDIWLKSRQIYATTLELARDIWFWLTRPGAAVRVVCQTVKDKHIFVDLAKRISLMIASLEEQGLQLEYGARAVGRWLLPTRDGAAVLELMEAGATIQTANNVGRGGTTQRLHATEVGLWHMAATTLRAILKSVHGRAGDGSTEVVFESTPNGVSVMGEEGESGDRFHAPGGPHFHALWKRAVAKTSGYTAHFVPWFRHHEYRTPLSVDDKGELERMDPEDQPIHARRLREEYLVSVCGIDQEQLKWYRQQVATSGQNTTDQEYPSDPDSCFLLSGKSFFDRDRTIELLAKARDFVIAEPKTKIARGGAAGWLTLYKHPVVGHRYLISVDSSGGEGGDPAALQVYDWSARGEHVASLHGQFKPLELARIAAALGIRYGTVFPDRPRRWALVCVERNNMGSAVLQELERPGMLVDVVGDDAPVDLRVMAGLTRTLAGAYVDVQKAGEPLSYRGRLLAWAKQRPAPAYPDVWYDADGKTGWWTGAVSRSDGLMLLEQDHRQGRWETPDIELLDEMLVFVVTDGRAAAAPSKTDDKILCAMIAHAVMSRPPVPQVQRSFVHMPPA